MPSVLPGYRFILCRERAAVFFILPEFVLEKSLLTPQEKEQILMALQGLAVAEDSRTDELLTKLGGLFRVQGANWI